MKDMDTGKFARETNLQTEIGNENKREKSDRIQPNGSHDFFPSVKRTRSYAVLKSEKEGKSGLLMPSCSFMTALSVSK